MHYNRTSIPVTIPIGVMLCLFRKFLLSFSMAALELQVSCVCAFL